MASRTSLISVILLLIIPLNESLRIMVFFPLPFKSHAILGDAVARHLLEAGHEVVHVTSFPTDNPNTKLKEINVGQIGENIRKETKMDETYTLKNLVGKHESMTTFLFVFYFSHDFHKQLFSFKDVADFLSDPEEQFDAVISQWLYSDYVAGLAPLFKCPLIWFGSTEAHWQLLRLVDDIPNPAYSVDAYSENRPPLSLNERIWEMGMLIIKYLTMIFVIAPLEESAYKDVFTPLAAKRGVTMPTYSEAVYNGSMLLLNSHPSIGSAFSLPQNAKYIAGFHIDTKVKPLPEDLQKIMDEAANGVIYFSMGSNLKSSDMSEVMVASVLETFGKLEQTVIWKFETEITNLPTNVHLVKWAPQLSILSHPNLKIFITHGGQLSTTEAIHFGIPMIGVPAYVDQHVNMRSIASKGCGISVTLTEDLSVSLDTAINEMLTNNSYKEKAVEISTWYSNRLRTPGEEMVHWIEYTVATQGAPHLRSPALQVPCYQKLHLDIIGILLGIMTVLVTFIRGLCKLCTGQEETKIQKKKRRLKAIRSSR